MILLSKGTFIESFLFFGIREVWTWTKLYILGSKTVRNDVFKKKNTIKTYLIIAQLCQTGN